MGETYNHFHQGLIFPLQEMEEFQTQGMNKGRQHNLLRGQEYCN